MKNTEFNLTEKQINQRLKENGITISKTDFSKSKITNPKIIDIFEDFGKGLILYILTEEYKNDEGADLINTEYYIEVNESKFLKNYGLAGYGKFTREFKKWDFEFFKLIGESEYYLSLKDLKIRKVKSYLNIQDFIPTFKIGEAVFIVDGNKFDTIEGIRLGSNRENF